MSRSGYSDDCEHLGLWRGAVHRAITGYRGQHLLKKLRVALEALPSKRLIADDIKDEHGDVCALGALDPTVAEYSATYLAEHFGIAHALAAEIVYMNDEYPTSWWEGNTRHDETPEKRWTRMRDWVASLITPDTPEAVAAVDPADGSTTA